MAQAAATNFFIYQGPRDVQFTNSIHYNFAEFHGMILSSSHAIFAFILTSLISLLQIKYHEKDQSPFESHPKTMLAAITSLIAYCISYIFTLKNSRYPSSSSSLSRLSRTLSFLTRTVRVFSAPLTLASILSMLFPGSLTSPLLFSLSIFFSLSQLLAPHIQAILVWITKAARNIARKCYDRSHNGGTRRGRLPV